MLSGHFENSICEDYVTEKFWNSLNGSIVPIVLGASPHHKEIAPPHSFIDVTDFRHPKDLSNYLHFLAQNATAYNSYFLWKDYFNVALELGLSGSDSGSGVGAGSQAFCNLCDVYVICNA